MHPLFSNFRFDCLSLWANMIYTSYSRQYSLHGLIWGIQCDLKSNTFVAVENYLSNVIFLCYQVLVGEYLIKLEIKLDPVISISYILNQISCNMFIEIIDRICKKQHHLVVEGQPNFCWKWFRTTCISIIGLSSISKRSVSFLRNKNS